MNSTVCRCKVTFSLACNNQKTVICVSTQRTYGAHGNTHWFCGMGVDANVKILENFATRVTPVLGCQPNRKGLVIGYPID